jgi:4-hydroxybenzoate polyprenyltransferase/phosphoserine phosphatase
MAVVEAPELTTPLCVDLDGTLIRSDLLLESVMILLKRNPLYLCLFLLWLLRGKAAFKAEVTARVSINPASLPYNRDFLDWLKIQRATGRPLWLCTAANEHVAGLVSAHLGMFSGVVASDERINLAGKNKAERLVELFGERGFDYCGNERRDMAIWKRARGAVIVGANRGLEQQATRDTSVLRVFPSNFNKLRAAVRALRPHQWAKNALLFVPLLAAHRLSNASALGSAVLALLAFCACASSVYILNDLLDLEADRAHPRKSKRPFASGALSIGVGLILAPCLLGTSVLIALFLPLKFAAALAAYCALTSVYSFYLKRFLLVDALALAGLYTLRIIAGATAIDVPLSFWLLLFSVFLFLSLAFVKRFAELDALRRQQGLRAVGRGYYVEDLNVLQSLGSAAGYLSVLVLALYINSPEIEALYSRPKFVWMLCVLMLYWISRVWMMAQRGHMHDDPVVFALKDRQSLAIGLCSALTVVLAV